MTNDLLTAVRDLPKVSPYLHVPAQSGSNRILELMKRGYTVEDYREMMGRIREFVPDAAVTSDFIVGFCGETDEEFQLTYELLRECRFKNSFIFKYSERAGTKAAELMPDDVPYDVKQWRNNELLGLQNAIAEELNQEFLGRTVEVLVEGPSDWQKKQPETGPVVQLTGRTSCDRIVVFDGTERQIGQFLPIAIYEVSAHTMFGAVLTAEHGPELFEIAQ